MIKCPECDKELKNKLALNSHKSMHTHSAEERSNKTKAGNLTKLIKEKLNYIPTKCKQCLIENSFEDRKNDFCSDNCKHEFLENPKNHNKICIICSKSYFGNSNCCSTSCRNKNRGPMSKDTKNKIRKSILISCPPPSKIIKICEVCLNLFATKNKFVKTCSHNCATECRKQSFKSNTNKKPMGGHRENANCGSGKSGWYKGYHCDSTYELAYLIYHLDNGIEIERNKERFDYYNPISGKNSFYLPDFIVNDELIEIKGIRSELNYIKLQAVKTRNIKILHYEDLKEIFNYVEEKYKIKIKNLFTLYDGYKPKYKHICKECHSEYLNNSKKSVYCSRFCSAKGNRSARKYHLK